VWQAARAQPALTGVKAGQRFTFGTVAAAHSSKPTACIPLTLASTQDVSACTPGVIKTLDRSVNTHPEDHSVSRHVVLNDNM
jgi:hypothetical protein